MTDRPTLLAVEVPAAEVDLASGLLWLAGAGAIEERPAPDGGVTLVAAVPSEEAVRHRLGGRWPVRSLPVEPEERWRDAWRPWAVAVPVDAPGGGLVVAPPWLGVEDVPAERVVRVDPGGAFGHGAHPTTRLALDLLARQVRPGDRVLDVGSGSGVLSVVAARLGAAEVVAVDTDPEARRVTTDNAVRNQLAVEVVAGLDTVTGTFDVVVANLDAPTLVALGPSIAARAVPGASVILTGVLVDRADAVAAACGGTVVHRAEREGWAAIVLWPPTETAP